ncbi:MAG: DUF1778 domain-containing protein [Solirubrobacteraceae bacterium]
MNEPGTGRRGRINMRVNERQEQVLRAAADLKGETLSAFVLAAATEQAEDVLAQGRRIHVSAEAFERFLTELDRPPEEDPVLRRYAQKRSPFSTVE